MYNINNLLNNLIKYTQIKIRIYEMLEFKLATCYL